MDDLLVALRKFDALRDGESGNDVVSQAELGAIASTYSQSATLDSLSPPLVTALEIRLRTLCYQRRRLPRRARTAYSYFGQLHWRAQSGVTCAGLPRRVRSLGVAST